MKNDTTENRRDATSCNVSRRERLQALLFTAGSIGTALLTLGMLADVKLPKVQGE